MTRTTFLASLAGALAGSALGLAAAAAAPADEIYVPLGGAGKVLVVDAASDRAVGTIEGLPAAHGLAATPDGRFLVVGSFSEREPGSAPPKPQGMSQEEHAAHHGMAGMDMKKKGEGAGGMAMEAAKPVSTVSVVDLEKREVVRRIDVPGAVHHVAVSPDGRFAVVTQPNADTVTAIDLSDFSVAATVPVGALPNYAMFAPDGGRVYVSSAGSDRVVEISVGDWKIARAIETGAGPEHLVIDAKGERLYVVNNGDGTVGEIDLAAGKQLRAIPVGDVLHGIDLGDDGRRLFVAIMGENKLIAYDLVTGTFRSTELASGPFHVMAVRGRGKLYVSSAEEPRIWVIDQKTLELRGEIPIEGKGHQMAQQLGS